MSIMARGSHLYYESTLLLLVFVVDMRLLQEHRFVLLLCQVEGSVLTCLLSGPGLWFAVVTDVMYLRTELCSLLWRC